MGGSRQIHSAPGIFWGLKGSLFGRVFWEEWCSLPTTISRTVQWQRIAHPIHLITAQEKEHVIYTQTRRRNAEDEMHYGACGRLLNSRKISGFYLFPWWPTIL